MKRLLLLTFIGFQGLFINAQLLSWSPEFPTENSSPVVITLDASKGNRALFNYANTTDVYIHTGVITTSSANANDWKYVKFTWATTPTAANAILLATTNGNILSQED
jgi:hypothetical protein